MSKRRTPLSALAGNVAVAKKPYTARSAELVETGFGSVGGLAGVKPAAEKVPSTKGSTDPVVVTPAEAVQHLAHADVRVARGSCVSLSRLSIDDLHALAAAPAVDINRAFRRAFKNHGSDLKLTVRAWSLLSRLAEAGKPLAAVASAAADTLGEWMMAMVRSEHATDAEAGLCALDTIAGLLTHNLTSIRLVPICCDAIAHASGAEPKPSSDTLLPAALAVSAALKSNTSRVGVSRSTLPALLTMMRERPKLASKLGRRGAAAGLTSVALAHVKHADICTDAYRALALFDADHLQGRFSKDLGRGAVEALRAYGSHDAVLTRNAAVVIARVAPNRETEQALQRAFVVDSLMSALRQRTAGRASDSAVPEDKETRGAVDALLSALLAIARAERGSEHFGHGAVALALAPLMSKRQLDVDKSRTCSFISAESLVSSIVDGSSSKRSVLRFANIAVTSMLADTLATAAHTFERNEAIVCNSLSSLRSMAAATNNSSCCYVLATQGAASAASRAMALHGHDSDVAYYACELIAELTGYFALAPALIAAGAADVLLAAVRWHPGSASIIAAVCSAVINLCRYAPTAALSLEQLSSLLEMLLRILRDCEKPSHQPFTAACEALGAIASLLCRTMRAPLRSSESDAEAPLSTSLLAPPTDSASGDGSSFSGVHGNGAAAGGAAAAAVDTNSRIAAADASRRCVLPSWLPPVLAGAGEQLARAARRCSSDDVAFRYAAEALHWLCTAFSPELTAESAAAKVAWGRLNKAWYELSIARRAHLRRVNALAAAMTGGADAVEAALQIAADKETFVPMLPMFTSATLSGNTAALSALLQWYGVGMAGNAVDQSIKLAAAAGDMRMLQALLVPHDALRSGLKQQASASGASASAAASGSDGAGAAVGGAGAASSRTDYTAGSVVLDAISRDEDENDGCGSAGGGTDAGAGVGSAADAAAVETSAGSRAAGATSGAVGTSAGARAAGAASAAVASDASAASGTIAGDASAVPGAGAATAASGPKNSDSDSWADVFLVTDEKMGPQTPLGSALWLAAATGQLHAVRYLLARTPPGMSDSSDSINAALRMAASHGHFNIAQLLLQEGGADATHDNSIAVRLADRGGHTRVQHLLMDAAEAGADAF